jgi:hypothetical protein
MKCLFEIRDDMPIESVIDSLQDLLAECPYIDWRQAIAHPESDEAQGWGSSTIISRGKDDARYGKIGYFGDSCNLFLAVNAVRALPRLLRHISGLQMELLSLREDGK